MKIKTSRKNLSKDNFVITDGERICQVATKRHEEAEWISTEGFMDTERGTEGFKHIGI